METTVGVGDVMYAFQPLDLIRLRIPYEMNESNSLNASNVRIAMFMESLLGRAYQRL
jgi:hypothetical protein